MTEILILFAVASVSVALFFYKRMRDLKEQLYLAQRPFTLPPIKHIFIAHHYACATQWMDWIGFQKGEVKYVTDVSGVRGMRNITIHLCGMYWENPSWPEIKQYLDTIPPEEVRYKTHA